ncbi:PEP-CTERM sorting domain-containing protein [Pseudoduganella sp. UC29_106]|uniref:PEP-CTERM sorting domain-containing protein n=1 Tax=Pseudoduganella sp. UC29_106 TaxID=3374553 RepID=UPI003756D80D
MKFILGLIAMVAVIDAQAGTYDPSNDPWYTQPTTHLTSGAFATARSVLPTFNSSTGLYDIAYDGLFGTDQVTLTAPGAYLSAQSQMGKSTGYASADPVRLSANQTWDGNGTFFTGWRDVWTVSGLSGSTLLKISGHTDGHMNGWAYLSSGISVITTTPNGSSYSALVGYTLSANGGHTQSTCFNCVVGYDFVDGMDIANFTLSVLVSNGDKVRIDGNFQGSVSSVYGPGAVIDGLHTSAIDFISGDQPLVLTSDSGKLISTENGFQYSLDVNSVPEPNALLLLTIGCFALVAVRKARQ